MTPVMDRGARYAMGPTPNEVLDAENAGFLSIDEGHGFWYGFENRLEALGYKHVVEALCSCPDGGLRGHMAECRWLRDWPA